MTKRGQLRYEYFIETGIVWIDTNDNIEMDYLKWVENKALTITDVSQRSELLQKIESVKNFEWGINPVDNENRMCELIKLL